MPLNRAPAIRSPTGSWLASATSRSQATSPIHDDSQVNGTRVVSPVPDGRASRQDKKRLSLAFLTKGVLIGDTGKEKEKDTKFEKRSTDDDESVATSTRSHSKEISRNRLSLSFLNHAPSSPQPEALPSFPMHDAMRATDSQSSLQRTSSQKRPETSKSGKSGKSDKSGTSRTSSVKKRLSFMNISKKSSKSSVRDRVDDTLVEE